MEINKKNEVELAGFWVNRLALKQALNALSGRNICLAYVSYSKQITITDGDTRVIIPSAM